MNASVYDFDEFENDLNVHRLPLSTKFEYKMQVKSFVDSTDFIVTKIKHIVQKTSDFTGFMTIHEKILTDEEKEQKRLENIERSARRARQLVHHSVRQIQADHMLTLSTREAITDREEFFKVFTKFTRLVREKELKNNVLVSCERKYYPFVAVPELQERGAFHMHCAVVGKQDLALLRACWYVALGGKTTDVGEQARGQVDVQYRKKMWGNSTENFKTFALVKYMTKYISKGFESDTQLGLHRYTRSRDIKPPHKSDYILFACHANGNTFADVIMEASRHAEFITGIHPTELQTWNRKDEILILRAFNHG